MKVIWNIDKTIAIPVDKVKSFEIYSYKQYNGEPIYKVLAHYTIATGLKEVVFEAKTKEKCMTFISEI